MWRLIDIGAHLLDDGMTGHIAPILINSKFIILFQHCRIAKVGSTS